jgi:hypothetical protein
MSNASFRAILYFCIVLPIYLAGCGIARTSTQEMPGLPPTKPVPVQATRTAPALLPPSEPTPSASPTSAVVFDLSEYDPDIHPAIVVGHLPPLIAKADEIVSLVFDITSSTSCGEGQGYCQIESLLYYSYGDDNPFESVPLNTETINGVEALTARLPATDAEGKSLRYYAQFSIPQAGYSLRYPLAGTIQTFAASSLQIIELPAAKDVKPGDKVYKFYWGYGPNTVRFATEGGSKVGPPAMDVAGDGRIAFLNPINEQVLIYNPREETYSNLPLPFTYSGEGDLGFDQDGQLMVCDFIGQGGPKTIDSIPHCYRLSLDGELVGTAPVYVNRPSPELRADLRILDYYDYRLITPFRQNEAISREAQRQRQIWELPYELGTRREGSVDWDMARFADIKEEVAFEAHSDSGLGSIIGFEKTPQGYLMMFNSGLEQIRAIWIDRAGLALKDITLPNGQYSSLVIHGSVAVAQDGSLYVMSSTKNGIEVHVVQAP